MKVRCFGRQKYIYSAMGAVLALLSSAVAHSAATMIVAPQNGATVSGTTPVTISRASNVSWANFYVDGRYEASTPPDTWYWNTTGYSEGSHTVSASAFSSSHALLGTVSVTVMVANNQVACSSPGLASGQTMSDAQAASAVVPTQKSRIESGPDASVNAAANSYFYNFGSSANYAHQLAAFHAAWRDDAVMQRVDGACLLGPHPTTAEILQWAAHKWGFSPLVSYAEATNDGHWDMAALGDSGCSVGVAQVAFCNNATHRNHAIRGLNIGQGGHLLPKENTCFNADLHAAFLFKYYTGSGCAHDDLAMSIQEWESGQRACSLRRFAQVNCNSIETQDWNTSFFNGAQVPY